MNGETAIGHKSNISWSYFWSLVLNMKSKKRASLSVAKETKALLDSIKRLGQSYDGIIRELYMCRKKKQETEEEKSDR